ncbi:aminotransferase class I/II-fold pyridoxal phosphate-dependent enzyme [Mesorhizobium sp. SP-1A]|uniref:aminotransferase class I/II-fold pyridoxal phosphate-dependent enzyme n=1 Tax=Mesorhizobium sp. SP-1A TaxID=3077840 RepID=UPI0028F6D9E9|nr:aminotransferase class I/II-fold pyridoxal phosphate-dependent enzyme [Mesorhizobium sp. SP-1A]
MPSYGKGRAGQAVPFAHRLGSNEAPDAPSPAVQAAAAAAIAGAHRYPDLRGETLAEVLAKRHGVPADAVAVSAGSIVLLDQLIRAYCDPGDRVVTPWRSYEAYPIIVGGAGARLVEVPLDGDHRLNAAAMLDACREGARVVLLCNPNNPTGIGLAAAELDALLDALPVETLVILDEAYADYAADAATVAASPARRLARHPNLAVLRTFSKAWGLAGMRVGYCLADPGIIAAVNAVAPPFPLPAPALAAALAALGEEDVVARRVAVGIDQRHRMSEGLVTMGLPVAASQANFIWLAVGAEAEALTGYLREACIAVRCFPGEGVRITTGTAADTEALLAAVAGWKRAADRR